MNETQRIKVSAIVCPIYSIYFLFQSLFNILKEKSTLAVVFSIIGALGSAYLSVFFLKLKKKVNKPNEPTG